MKIQVYSDLHLEFCNEFPKIQPICDYLILAGDIGILHKTCFKEFIEYVNEHWKKTIYIMGNHEYYKHKDMDNVFKSYVTFFEEYQNIILLQNGKIKIHDDETGEIWHIMGSTLWGIYPDEAPYDYISSLKKIYKKQTLNKNGKICVRTNPLTREIFNELYYTDKSWILNNYNSNENTILITHFPVKIEGTSHPMWDSEKYKTIFATDLYLDLEQKYYDTNNTDQTSVNNNHNVEIISEKCKLVCISGHTHYSHYFINNNITYISNQYGTQDEKNDGITDFNIDGVYEI